MKLGGLLTVLIVTIGCVFLSVLAIIGMVKLIQIAEDLRWLRSQKDSSVQPPKTTKNTMTVALILSSIIVLLLVSGLLSGVTVLPPIGSSTII